MRPRRRAARPLGSVCAAALLLSAAGVAGGGEARAADPVQTLAVAVAEAGVRELAERNTFVPHPSVRETVEAWAQTPAGRAQLRSAGTRPAVTPPVGTRRLWPAADERSGTDYLKEFTLRAVGPHIEVWVATGRAPDGVTGTDFPAGDCRSAVAGSTNVTDAQVRGLVRSYERTILPTQSRAFSVAPARAGTRPAKVESVKGLDFSGDGDRVVTLVDNIRDAHFYDDGLNTSYVAGFFAPGYNVLTDRNVMTLDAYDWAHRTGARPRDEPTGNLCTSRSAHPRLYEATFAHEYQHLLQFYVDPAERDLLNEGLSDYAASLAGYSRADRSVFESGHDASVACFQGFGTLRTAHNAHPTECGGPANSLTRWGDQGDGAEILADYGTAWSFALFLRDRFGPAVLTRLHRDARRQGLASVRAALEALPARYRRPALADVLHDYQLMTLVDRLAGTPGATLSGVPRSLVSAAGLASGVNLLNPAALSAPGAAPNGADYVILREQGLAGVSGDDLRSVTFSGARTLPGMPTTWAVAPRIPLPTLSLPPRPGVPPVRDVPPPEVPGAVERALKNTGLENPVLFSGNAPNTDASAVFEVTVPAANPVLTYTSSYLLEDGFDYAYTVVSTDGGRTYSTLANNSTEATLAPAPPGEGFTGNAQIPVPEVFDLSAYAGERVLLGFRYVSDGAVDRGGWYVDDVRVGGVLVSDGGSLAPFRSYTQVRAEPVAGWSFQLVGIDEGRRRVHVARFSGQHAVTLTRRQLAAFRGFPVVVAVIGFDDPAERAIAPAPYLVRVNDVGQAGGR